MQFKSNVIVTVLWVSDHYVTANNIGVVIIGINVSNFEARQVLRSNEDMSENDTCMLDGHVLILFRLPEEPFRTEYLLWFRHVWLQIAAEHLPQGKRIHNH